MLTRRENLFRVFRHEMPEWIPMPGHVDPYNQPKRDDTMDPELALKLAKVQWADESAVHFCRYLGLDITDWYSAPLKQEPGPSIAVEERQEGDEHITLWHTPAGDLRQVSRRCREDGTAYLVEHAIKSAGDLPALACIHESARIETDTARLPDLQRRKALIGEDGLLLFSLPGTPLGQLVRVWAGVETTAYLAVDAPDALRDLLTVMEGNHLRQFELAAAMDGDALVGVDDTSTTTISPRMFEAFCMDYTDHIADAVHKKGKLYLHHSCGLIRDLVGLYRQTRMDCVHALQIPPVGNVTIREAKEKLGPGVVIFASFVQMMWSFNDWAAVCRSVREMYEGAAPGDNMIIGLAPDPNKNMAETARLVDEARKWQRMYCPPPGRRPLQPRERKTGRKT